MPPSTSSDFAELQAPTPPSARWVVRSSDPGAARLLADGLGLPPLVARILAARELTDSAEASRFLKPTLAQIHDPFLLRGMEAAVARIGKALKAGETIWIYGDYDVDGLTATTLLRQTLMALGGKVDYYIPHRVNEGYGINSDSIEDLAARGATLIVTVDCGISAVEQALLARGLGIDLIVTDHHEPGENLPEAFALINPLQPGCAYPFKKLAGVGVAFKLAHALLKTHHKDEAVARETLKSLLDLVALGTVADVVPLVGENRALVAAGLERLRDCNHRIGIRRLCERAGIKQGLIEASHIGFGLGPRLNAAGRTEHAIFGAELLMAGESAEAGRLAEQLEIFNNNRRSIEMTMTTEALAMLEAHREDRVVVLAQDGWHPGVMGIVASRVVGATFRPAFIIGLDGETGKGSGRSIPGFDLHAALEACDSCLVRHGGHKMAAGLTVAAENVDEFRKRINAYAAENLDAGAMRPLVEIDAEASASELTIDAAQWLGRLAPYGQDNPKPVIAVTDLRLIDDPQIMKDKHMKLRLAGPRGETLTALCWNMAGRRAEVESCRGAIRVAGTPSINAWNGRETVELVLKDFQAG